VAVLCKLATAISINLASISDNCPLAMLVTGADKILSAKRQETSYYPSGCRCLVTEQEVAVNEYSCSVLHSDTLLHITDFCPLPLAFLFLQKVPCYFGHKLLC